MTRLALIIWLDVTVLALLAAALYHAALPAWIGRTRAYDGPASEHWQFWVLTGLWLVVGLLLRWLLRRVLPPEHKLHHLPGARLMVGITFTLIVTLGIVVLVATALIFSSDASLLSIPAHGWLLAGVAIATLIFHDEIVLAYARLVRPITQVLRSLRLGTGGATKYAGLLSEFVHFVPLPFRYRSGIFLGRSLYMPWRFMTIGDDRHILTIAGARAGKGRSLIIPNLLTWRQSALVIDPKGTNADVTAAYRAGGGGRVTGGLGQRVILIDPFGETHIDPSDYAPGFEIGSYNPLADIDADDLRATDAISDLARAIVLPEDQKYEHFVEGAQELFSGLVAHILTQPDPTKRTLTELRNIVRLGLDRAARQYAADMMANEHPIVGKLARGAGIQMDDAASDAVAQFWNTLNKNVKWLDSDLIARSLEQSSFSMFDLKNEDMTIYVVVSPTEVEKHKRFMRMFISQAQMALVSSARNPRQVLFIIDEFQNLGRMDYLMTASAQFPSYGVKLWPIIQNLGRVKDMYGASWGTFYENAGLANFFAVSDESARFVADQLGDVVWTEKDEKGRTQSRRNRFRGPEEIETEFNRDGGLALCRSRDGINYLLRRVNYDECWAFRGRWNYDPDHAPTSLTARKHRPGWGQKAQPEPVTVSVDEAMNIFSLHPPFGAAELDARLKMFEPMMKSSAEARTRIDSAYNVLRPLAS